MIFTNDNYSTVAKKIAQFVAENAPAGAEGQVERLVAWLASGEKIDMIDGIHFHSKGVSLYVSREDAIAGGGYEEDSEGNL